MTAPSLEPEAPTAADLLIGRATLLREIAQYVAHWGLDFAALSLTSHGVEFQSADHASAVAVAAGFGAVPQDDHRTVVTNGWAWAHESWASDVLRVSWCKRLDVAA